MVATQTIHSPGVSTHLELQADTAGRDLTADGLTLVRVYARRRARTTYPNGNDLVAFTVQGPGTIIDDARIRANPVNAEAGIATVLIRASTTPHHHHSGRGFRSQPGVATIESQPYAWPRL